MLALRLGLQYLPRHAIQHAAALDGRDAACTRLRCQQTEQTSSAGAQHHSM
jgi:hypothetical protein